MAYELLTGALLFRPMDNPPSSHEDAEAIVTMLEETGEYVQAGQPELPTGTPYPVVYNFQHDLESLWWIALWILTARVDHPASQLYAQLIFINGLQCSNERANVFTREDHLAAQLREVLHEKLHSFIGYSADFGKLLWSAYMQRE